jgi:conjugal transfer pilus assembly protein TraF
MNKASILFLAFIFISPIAAADSFYGRSSTAADNKSDNRSFYGGKEGKGYYQYAEPEAEAAPDNNTKSKRPVIPPDEVLYEMPAEEFQALYTATLNYALTKRNLDTYRDYARMIHMVNVRAKEFTSLHVLYAQLNPVEDENQFRGKTTRRLIDIQKSETLKAYSDRYGLIYFFSPQCPYCQKFKPLLDEFIEQYGFEVEYVDVTLEPELSEAFGITATPTVKMVTPKDDILSINNGMITLEDFETRIYRYIRYLEGITDELNFNKSM